MKKPRKSRKKGKKEKKVQIFYSIFAERYANINAANAETV